MPRPPVFRDPIHGLLRIEPGDEFLVELIDSPEFQRLRRVRQLGVSHFTYPGAEHTRFNHSLGVLHVAQRILDMLERRYGRDSGIGRQINEHSRSVKAAALLHDTGHGAFSHLMERAFKDTADHEARSQQIISGAESSLPALFKKHGLDAGNVAGIVGKVFPIRFLQDIVSSSLDADRMDYLLRDAHFTGVRYGIFDLEWLLHAVCLGTLTEPGEGGEKTMRLCLDRKRALHSAEQMLLARQHMSVQVYFHKSTRRWEAHLLCLFREASRLALEENLPLGTPSLISEYFRTRGGVIHAVFLRIDEPSIIGAINLWSSTAGPAHRLLADLSLAYLERKKIFQMLEIPASASAAAEWEQKLKELGPEWENHWELDYITFTAYKMPKAGEQETDPESYFQRIAASAVLISSGDPKEEATPVEDDSPIFRTLGGPDQPRFLRLFFLEPLQNKIEELERSLRLVERS